ncbi:phage tail protein [Streptomyces sp. NPDC059916]|uniref:phage tail protein n=1 Tax=Streptomyces sp. NPDC059916 TaxID=3347001 RepID=UPI0036763075
MPSTPPGAGPQPLLGGATVTDGDYLVVGTLEPPGLLVFDLATGGPPGRRKWPDGVPFRPYDLASASGGRLFVLDRENRRLWELDRHLLVVCRTLRTPEADPAPTFGPECSGTPTAGFTGAARKPVLDDGIELGPVPGPEPVAVAGATGEGALVLFTEGSGPGSVQWFHQGKSVGERVALYSGGEAVRGLDMELLPPGRGCADRAELVVADERGDRSFSWTVTFSDEGIRLEPSSRYLPMRLFSGKALLRYGGVLHYDVGDRWVPLVEQSLARYAPSGVVETFTLDSELPGCTWHRVMLDVCLPPGTSITVASTASDDDPDEAARWQPEPAPYRRPHGSDLPFVRTGAGYGTVETLLQHARGRYLRLRIEMHGDGRSTPRIRSTRVYFPRFSYLERYLPAVYREDRTSASFLERFLANPEGILTAIEDQVALAHGLFDGRSTPSEALQWLASWFELTTDPAWDERRTRVVLRHAMQLFQWRGTVRGLRAALALALDPASGPEVFSPSPGAYQRGIRIVEACRTRRVPPAEPDVSTRPPLLKTAARFRVLLPLGVGTQESGVDFATDAPGESRAAQLALAQRVVDLERPAHTVFDVQFYWSAFRTGEARLGLDTTVDRGSRSPGLLADAVLGAVYLGQGLIGHPGYDAPLRQETRGVQTTCGCARPSGGSP